MSHQPFETWIFSNDPLETDQKQTLEDHLKDCQSCTQQADALISFEAAISSTSLLSPMPGFTQRWHNRLPLARQLRQQRKMWLLAISLFAGATLILTALFLINASQINLAYQFGLCIASVARVRGFLYQLWPALQSFLSTMPIIIPILIVFGFGSLTAIIVLIITWFSSILRLYQPVQEGVSTR